MQTRRVLVTPQARSNRLAIWELTTMDDSTTKQCSTCKQILPATTEYFHKSAKHQFGLLYDCKVCANTKKRENTRKHGIKPYEPIRKDGQKRCGRCKTWKPETLEFFWIDTSRPGGFSPWCIDCCKRKWAENSDRYKTANARWREENAEYVKQQHLEYRTRPEIREKKRQQTEDWRKEHPEQAKEAGKNWRLKNPHKVKVSNERRRTRKKNLPDTITATEWESTLDYFNHSCAACGRPAGLWHRLAMDHWIPLDVENCPGTIKTNCIPLCHGADGCNNSKHNKMPDVWLNRKFGKRKAKQIIDRVESYFRSLM